jgi:phytanoyl-CoA hydroxylase
MDLVEPTSYMKNNTMLNNEQINNLNVFGYVVIKNVVSQNLLGEITSVFNLWLSKMLYDWKKEGVNIPEEFISEVNIYNFLSIWEQLGKPNFRRRPNKYLINEQVYKIMTNEFLIGIAKLILGTSDISSHGIFNARCQFPNHQETKTPVHQDTQYWVLDYGKGDQTSLIQNHKLFTFWIPLDNVNKESGAMEVIPKTDFGNTLFSPYDYAYEETGFLGLSPTELSKHKLIPIEMEKGDLLIFDQLVPHGATKNISPNIRWSLDIRYELTATRPEIGKKYGFQIDSDNSSKKEWLLRKQS